MSAVLFIGGMDSSGGAGLLRDAATAAELGAASRVAVTAVTAQSDRSMAASQPMAGAMVAAQIALAAEGGIGAAKTGMLANAEIIEAVAASLPPLPLVIDPVLRSSSGHVLLDEPGIAALLVQLLPQAALLTPNLPELAVLAAHLGLAAETPESRIAEALLACGCGAVLVKGGHAEGSAHSEDRLYRLGQPLLHFTAPRIAATLRGTGCQLASAITVRLAVGLPLARAIAEAKAMLTRRFERAAGDAERSTPAQ